MKNKEKVLVTGGLGFIGSHLIKELSKKYDTFVLDDLSNNKVTELAMIDTITYENIFLGSINDYKLLKHITKNIKYIFHLAAISSVPESFKDPIKTEQVNIKGTINILNIAKENQVKKVIFASSSAIYEPKSPYAYSKLTGERYCSYILPDNSISLRLFNVYGKRQGNNVIRCFLDKIKKNEPLEIYGDGKAVRDYIHINDIVRAFIYFAENNITNKSLNIGTGIGTTLNLLAYLMSSNHKILYKEKRQGDANYSCADTKIANNYGYFSSIRLSEGLKKLKE